MAKELPRLDVLNPGQKDYVKSLDAGLIELHRIASGLDQKVDTYLKDSDPIAYLKGKGFVFTPGLSLDLGAIGAGSLEGQLTGDLFGIVKPEDDDAVAFGRRLEDELETYEDLRAAELKGFKREKKTVTRRTEDFMTAVTECTEVSPLNEEKQAPDSLHIYVVRQDAVYEMHTGKAGIIGPFKSKLEPSSFEDKNFLEEFERNSKDVGGIAYKVTNPSEVLPCEILIMYACTAIAARYMVDARAQEESNPRSDAERAVDQLRKLAEHLKGSKLET